MGDFGQIIAGHHREAWMVPQHDWLDSFGAHLARVRRERQLTQEQVADRAGLSVRAISSLERGARHPRRLTVERLATGLGLAPRERQHLLDAAADERRPMPPASSTAASAAAIPLIGRDTQRDVLRRHLDGEGPPLWCCLGEPGIGKTRLLAEAATMAAARGSPVLTAGSRRGGEPYTPLVDALAGYAARISPATVAMMLRECPGIDLLLPELATGTGSRTVVPPGQGHRLAFDAATRFVRQIGSGPAPAVLILDDMQWAGPAAADLLCHLVRQAGAALRVVIAVRIGDLAMTSRLARCLADLARQGLTGHHRLPPLTPEASDDLVAAVAAGTTPVTRPARTAVLRRSAGLPLFLVELTRAAIRGGDEIPEYLRVAVHQQLADLAEPGPAVLRRLAWTGETAPLHALAAADTGTGTTDRLLDALEDAVRRGILEETEKGFRFRYPLMREVLAQELGLARRQMWRERVGARTGRAVGRRLPAQERSQLSG